MQAFLQLQALLFTVVCGLLIVVASLVEHRLSVHEIQCLRHVGSVVVSRLSTVSSVVVAHRLSCSVVCRIFLDQGLTELESSALAGKFFTTQPPGKPSKL